MAHVFFFTQSYPEGCQGLDPVSFPSELGPPGTGWAEQGVYPIFDIHVQIGGLQSLSVPT